MLNLGTAETHFSALSNDIRLGLLFFFGLQNSDSPPCLMLVKLNFCGKCFFRFFDTRPEPAILSVDKMQADERKGIFTCITWFKNGNLFSVWRRHYPSLNFHCLT